MQVLGPAAAVHLLSDIRLLLLQAKPGMTEDVLKAITDCSVRMSKGRKQRAQAPELATVDDLAAFQLLGSQPLHKTGKVHLRSATRAAASRRQFGGLRVSDAACFNFCSVTSRETRAILPPRDPLRFILSRSASRLQGGIKAIDTSPASSAVVATAGGDGVVAVYDSAAGRLLAELKGHSKKVNGECAVAVPQRSRMARWMDKCSTAAPDQQHQGCNR